jgi:integrase
MAKKINYADMFTLRKDGRYQASYVDEKGARRYVYDRDAEKLYNKIEDAKKPHIKTFAEVADSWQTKHWGVIAFKTQEAYIAHLKRLTAQFGKLEIRNITAAQLQAYISSFAKRGYARRTVQMSLDILRMIFNHAILDGAISANPCDAVSIPRGLPTAKREMPTEDEMAIIKQSVSAPFGLFAILCFYTGLRRGEALALRYEDIDRKAKIITVNKSVSFEGNRPVVKSTKTAAGERKVLLLDALAEILPTGDGLIFDNGNGGLLTKTQYRKRWQRYCEATGIDTTAHQLRHGYATILFEAEIPDKDAQELLGHSSIAVTRDVYTHIRQSRRQETADKLNAFMSNSMSKTP